MRAFATQGRAGFQPEHNRLETPAMTGYRSGMSSSGVIGRKLGSVYGVQSDVPEEMGAALRQLQTRLRQSR